VLLIPTRILRIPRNFSETCAWIIDKYRVQFAEQAQSLLDAALLAIERGESCQEMTGLIGRDGSIQMCADSEGPPGLLDARSWGSHRLPGLAAPGFGPGGGSRRAQAVPARRRVAGLPVADRACPIPAEPPGLVRAVSQTRIEVPTLPSVEPGISGRKSRLRRTAPDAPSSIGLPGVRNLAP
jgi:hypothetical protein